MLFQNLAPPIKKQNLFFLLWNVARTLWPPLLTRIWSKWHCATSETSSEKETGLQTFSFSCCLSAPSSWEPSDHTVRKMKLFQIKRSWGPQPRASINLQTCEWPSLQMTAVPSLWVFQPTSQPHWAEKSSAGIGPHSWPYKTSDHNKWLFGAIKFWGNLSPTIVAVDNCYSLSWSRYWEPMNRILLFWFSHVKIHR